jgi:hypothetical protein
MDQKKVEEIRENLPLFGDRVITSIDGVMVFSSGIVIKINSNIDLTNYRIVERSPHLLNLPQQYIRICLIFRSDKGFKDIIIKLSTLKDVDKFINHLRTRKIEESFDI